MIVRAPPWCATICKCIAACTAMASIGSSCRSLNDGVLMPTKCVDSNHILHYAYPRCLSSLPVKSEDPVCKFLTCSIRSFVVVIIHVSRVLLQHKQQHQSVAVAHLFPTSPGTAQGFSRPRSVRFLLSVPRALASSLQPWHTSLGRQRMGTRAQRLGLTGPRPRT